MKPEHKDIMKARKRNIRLTVAYDGTNYNGFQRQNPPAVAVQNILEDRLQKVFGLQDVPMQEFMPEGK